MSDIKLTFESGVGTVTGANFLLKTAKHNILVDCGLVQGEKFALDANREPFSYNPADIHVLMVTHAHLDHVGRIAKLAKEGFNGVIYSTPETKALATLILEDAVGLLKKEAQEQGIAPLYETPDLERALSLWKTISYHTQTAILPEVSVFLKDAGHILGSSMIEMTIEKNEKGEKIKVLFSGDLGNSPAPLLRDTEKISDVDYIIMESVYGDRNHEPHDLRREKLAKIINDTITKNGTVVIPAFSMERTQVLLYELNALVESGTIPSVPVFIDSPLATRITQVYRGSPELFNDAVKAELRHDDVFDFPKLTFTASVEDSKTIDRIHQSKIIVAGSGMSVGGRVGRHEALYLPDPNSTVLLVGYQTLGTIGRKLQDGVKKIEINRETVKVRARVDTILGYSAHKDSDHLLEFVADTASSVKKVFVAMGEPKASLFLVQKLRDNLGVDAVYPERQKEYILS